jgi:hypothetical protein
MPCKIVSPEGIMQMLLMEDGCCNFLTTVGVRYWVEERNCMSYYAIPQQIKESEYKLYHQLLQEGLGCGVCQHWEED